MMRDNAGYDWGAWFASGDPFAPYDDSEPARAAHLLRHGVGVGQAMKTRPALGAVPGSPPTRAGRGRRAQLERHAARRGRRHVLRRRESRRRTRRAADRDVLGRRGDALDAHELRDDGRRALGPARGARVQQPAALWPDVTATRTTTRRTRSARPPMRLRPLVLLHRQHAPGLAALRARRGARRQRRRRARHPGFAPAAAALADPAAGAGGTARSSSAAITRQRDACTLTVDAARAAGPTCACACRACRAWR